MTSSSEIFGSYAFSLDKMKKHLPRATFRALSESIHKGTNLSLNHADAIAHAMMEWAQGKGATHYTHWFHPMTGLTAQKHDAFLSLDSQSKPIDRFSGSQLIQSEPDASSFPSGGMRTTFEARGYTAWDPSSPVFVQKIGEVAVLFIPSVFFSYTGHALDKKTPLLRSLRNLNQAASHALELLIGEKAKINATVGFEQEYFLVDRDYYLKRPDLIMAGRTLLGSRPAKGQQMEDHYFGSIKTRVMAFMEDVETRLYALGVPCKTRHNEVAPHQFEMAPIFQIANIAADHNQIAMDVIKKTAEDHGLAALFHEKPFAGVNGSGKHINWSLATDEGENLLEPGHSPHANQVFLYFLTAVVHAVYKRGSLLRSTIATSSNDHRLGANEAPPAIMSVFLGEHLTGLFQKIENSTNLTEAVAASIDLGLSELPGIMVDTTDRNRTSPFAFTGNKFEMRACGSSQSISFPVSILNTAVAESLHEMNAKLEEIGKVDEKKLLKMLRPFVIESKAIRFEGNNYSDEWALEAANRGLDNYKTTPEAHRVFELADQRAFITDSGMLTQYEMDARTNVRLEHYSKQVDIEAGLLVRMVDNHVLPAAFRYQSEVSGSVQSLKMVAEETGLEDTIEESLLVQVQFLGRLSAAVGALLKARNKLSLIHDEIRGIDDVMDHAMGFAKQVLPAMNDVRQYADELESMIDAELWSLPTYHELLFLM